MSSILEALKKAEKESPKVDFTPELTKVDTRKAVSRRARGTRTLHRVMISTVVLVVLGLGGWLALSHEDLFSTKGPPRADTTVVEKGPAQPPLDAAVEAPGLDPVHEPTKKGTRRPADTKPADPNVAVDLEVKEGEPSETRPAGPRVAGSQGAGERIQSAETKPVGPTVAAVREMRPVRRQEPPAEQPPSPMPEAHPEEARFKLEAIVWAESPQSRFAVINGHIVRIGGSLEGVSVTAIEKDHVAARSKGREWKMRFVVE